MSMTNNRYAVNVTLPCSMSHHLTPIERYCLAKSWSNRSWRKDYTDDSMHLEVLLTEVEQVYKIVQFLFSFIPSIGYKVEVSKIDE